MSLLCSLITRDARVVDCDNHQPVEVEVPVFNNPDAPAFSTVEPPVSSLQSHRGDEAIKVSRNLWSADVLLSG